MAHAALSANEVFGIGSLPRGEAVVLDRQVRSQTEVDELVLTGEQYGFDVAECPIQLVWIFSIDLGIQHAMMVNRCVGAFCRCFRLNRPKQQSRGDAESMLGEVGYVARILVDPANPTFRECRTDNDESAPVAPSCAR